MIEAENILVKLVRDSYMSVTLIKLSEIGKEYEINTIKDVIPVFPNCHSMIHSKRPASKIDK